MKLDKGLIAGSSTLLVLSLLEKEDMYGLYPILHALEKGKYLSSYQQEAPTGRVRKYYAITPRGRELLSEKKAEWAQFSHGVDQVLSFS